MQYPPWRPSSSEKTYGNGDHKRKSKSSKDLLRKTSTREREQVLDLFGPATKQRFSPMHNVKRSSNSSSTSSTSSNSSKSDQTAVTSDLERQNANKNNKGYPYHGSFIVDMENEPDYHGKHLNRAPRHDRRSSDVTKNISNNMKPDNSKKEFNDQSETKSAIETNWVQPNGHNTPQIKPTYSAMPSTKRSSLFDKRFPFQSRGISSNNKKWRRWILVALLILIFFAMVCIILGYVLQQTAIYEDTIISLNAIKKTLDKCCLQKDMGKRNDTPTREVKENLLNA